MSQIVIHALSVGNGILAISELPGRGGDYAGDLDFIREWRPSLVISMTTLSEMFDLGALSLGNDLRERGTRWAHLPVVDFGAPDDDFDKKWPMVADMALSAMRGGGRVLVHCKGGCGRSGMAALRLMIEMGEAPAEALSRLRNVRPCAVETDAQFDWARRGRRRPAPKQQRSVG